MNRPSRRDLAVIARAVGWGATPLSLAVLGTETFVLPVRLPFYAIQAVWTVFTVILWWWGHRVLRQEKRRPDYAAIARLERDIWGQVFEHAGAVAADPVRSLPPPPASVSVRSCCGTRPDSGHRGTCPRSVMNGGMLTVAAHFSAALPAEIERQIISVHGIPPAHLARICECGRSPVLAQGLCGPCYRLVLYAGRLPGRR